MLNDGFGLALENVPNPFGLPNVDVAPNVAPEPNVGLADAASALKPKPVLCDCCGEPNALWAG